MILLIFILIRAKFPNNEMVYNYLKGFQNLDTYFERNLKDFNSSQNFLIDKYFIKKMKMKIKNL